MVVEIMHLMPTGVDLDLALVAALIVVNMVEELLVALQPEEPDIMDMMVQEAEVAIQEVVHMLGFMVVLPMY